MKYITVPLFTFGELSDVSKAKVLETWRDHEEWGWWAESRGSVEAFLSRVLGQSALKSFKYSISAWDASYGSVNVDRDVRWILPDAAIDSDQRDDSLSEAYAEDYREELYYNHTLDFWKELAQDCEDIKLTGYCADAFMPEVLRDWISNYPKNSEDKLTDLVQECIGAWISYLVGDLEYWYSEESILEDLYDFYPDALFYEDGSIYDLMGRA